MARDKQTANNVEMLAEQGWKAAFSNARIDDPTYIDAGDTVIALATGRGDNDGSFGPFPPTGKEIVFPFCEVVRFNDEGKIASGEVFYDQMTILTQLAMSMKYLRAKEQRREQPVGAWEALPPVQKPLKTT